MMSVETAKLFWSGSSQALRLPKAFRFEGNEVRIRKQGQKVILEPLVENWDWLDEFTAENADPSLQQAVESLRTESQERDWSVFE